MCEKFWSPVPCPTPMDPSTSVTLVEYIQTDIWVRFQKMRGNQCIYVCADDAHGTPIMLRARQQGVEPEQLIDAMSIEHRADFAKFNVGFDNYHTTHSEERTAFSPIRSTGATGRKGTYPCAPSPRRTTRSKNVSA